MNGFCGVGRSEIKISVPGKVTPLEILSVASSDVVISIISEGHGPQPCNVFASKTGVHGVKQHGVGMV